MKSKSGYRFIFVIIITALLFFVWKKALSVFGSFGFNFFGAGFITSNILILTGISFAILCLLVIKPALIINRKVLPMVTIVFFANYLHSEIMLPAIPGNTLNEPCGKLENFGNYDGYNLVMISLDTLRADHLGSFGYVRDTSPNIDLLTRDSVVFRNVYAPASSTLPSHASLMTGLHPNAHGASIALQTPLPAAANTLAERFKQLGYNTSAFTDGGQLNSFFGLTQGFDVYYDEGGGIKNIWPLSQEWIQNNADAPFFIFVHSYDIHAPYEPPAPFNTMFDPDYNGKLPETISVDLLDDINMEKTLIDKKDSHFIEALYDGGIRYMDEYIGRIVKFIDDSGLRDNTILVILSDHGEEFNEHGKIGIHGYSLYGELLHVPVIMRIKDVEPLDINNRVGLIDLYPTLLDMFGFQYTPGEVQGITAYPLISENKDCSNTPRTLLAQREFEAGIKNQIIGHLKSVTIGNTKFIMRASTNPIIRILHRVLGSVFYSSQELYDLETDPKEKHNLVPSHYRLARSMEKALFQNMKWNDAYRLQPENVSKQVDENTLQRLRDLGYIR